MTARAASRVFRLLVAALLTLYILLRGDPAAVLRVAAHANVSYVLLAMALTLIDRSLMAWRWLALLCIVDRSKRPPFRRLIEIFFVSTFLGTFLPASVGGDAVRAYSLSRDRVEGADAVASVFMDRMLGVASLLALGLVSLLLGRDLAGNGAVLAALAFTGTACLGTMLIIFSERLRVWCAALVGVLPAAMLSRAGFALVESVRRYARHRMVLFKVLVASVGVQILRVAQAYCLGRALGIDVGVSVYFASIPLILLVMLLPITINGLGTGQAAFVWFFGRIGVAHAPAFALSVLFVGLGVVGNLPGGLLYVFGQSSSKAVS